MITFTACSTFISDTFGDSSVLDSTARGDTVNGSKQGSMIEETMQESILINQLSWFGGLEFLQTVSSEEVGPEWNIVVPQGLDGHCFEFPYGEEIRLTDLTIVSNAVDSDRPYTLYGIELNTSYLDAHDALITAGYEIFDESNRDLPDKSVVKTRRLYCKYNIQITIELTSSEDSTALVKSLNCYAHDPDTGQVENSAY